MSVLLIDMVCAGRLHPLLVHFPIGLVLGAAGESRALEWHRWPAVAATSGAAFTAAATVVAERSPAALWIYRALLFASAAAVAVAAHLGGSLVWGADFLHF